MKKYFLSTLLLFSCYWAKAQTIFVDKGEVVYEQKTNLKKTMANSSWGEQMMKMLPEMKTVYNKLIFDGDKSLYTFSKWPDNDKLPAFMKEDDEGYKCYTDFGTGKMQRIKKFFGSEMGIDDSINKIQWHLTNDVREIAGFNCRKAFGKINDSVYVFAFYTNEITFTGGPASINGLPGLILGVTIPRLYTSWIATTVTVNGVDYSKLKPLSIKKPLTQAKLVETFEANTKDWFANSSEEERKQMQVMKWMLSL